MKIISNRQINNSELFVIPREDNTFILYTPLERKVGKINSSGVNTICKYLNDDILSEQQMIFIQELSEKGFIIEKEPNLPVFPKEFSFLPHEVTLFLTSRCNLKCLYCYADAGQKSIDMNYDIAEAAINLVAKNAGLLGHSKFAVGFHGGGEPTLSWDLMVKAVEHSYKVAEAKGLDVEIFAATNGLLTKKQCEYIASKFTTLNISMDGPAEIQNFNRPTKGKGNSFNTVYRNLKYFDKIGFNYGIRSTITERTVHRMEEIVEWFKAEFNLSYLHLEPVWLCGRCKSSGEQPPLDDDFIEYFLKALDKAKSIGLDVIYSGLRLDALVSKFCGAPGDAFNVLPEGIVTSCYEITEPDDRKAEIFHYGHFDKLTGSFLFDEKKIKRLQNYSVDKLDYCNDCFCKWHCAGDCISKVLDSSESFEHKGSSRCRLNRELTISKLEELLK